MRVVKESGDTLEIFFTKEELQLIKDVLGNTYSGAGLWRVTPEDFENTFGMGYDRVRQIDLSLRSLNQEEGQGLSLSRKEWFVIKIMVERLVQLWDEGDFSTLIATEKTKARTLLNQFTDILS